MIIKCFTDYIWKFHNVIYTQKHAIYLLFEQVNALTRNKLQELIHYLDPGDTNPEVNIGTFRSAISNWIGSLRCDNDLLFVYKYNFMPLLLSQNFDVHIWLSPWESIYPAGDHGVSLKSPSPIGCGVSVKACDW